MRRRVRAPRPEGTPPASKRRVLDFHRQCWENVPNWECPSSPEAPGTPPAASPAAPGTPPAEFEDQHVWGCPSSPDAGPDCEGLASDEDDFDENRLPSPDAGPCVGDREYSSFSPSSNRLLPTDADIDAYADDLESSEDDEDDESDDDDRGSESDEESTRPTAHPRPLLRSKERHVTSNDAWLVDETHVKAGFVTMRAKAHPKSVYVVPAARHRKAMKYLDPDNIAECLNPVKSCRNHCSRNCHTALGYEEVIAIRQEVFNHPSEHKTKTWMTQRLRASPKGYSLKGRRVCLAYYAKVHAFGEQRVTDCRKIARLGPTATTARKPRMETEVGRGDKYRVAYCFWEWFFGHHANRANYKTRLFPVNKPYHQIYKEHFLPWAERAKYEKHQLPELDWFRSARRHKDFSDVKKRSKHFHCRCPTCAELAARLLNGFMAGTDVERYERDRRIHDQEVEAWRLFEASLKSRAAMGEIQLFMYDDTEALGLPKLTNRPPKGVSHQRFRVIPWLLIDYTRNREEYVYMAKDRWGKGANRIITLLHGAVKRTKADYTSKSHKTRTMVCVADNYSENKNNELLAWASELIAEGLYDEVQLVYGPVGHTHNGVDAVHETHNNKVGNQTSGDLGEFVHNFVWGFPTELSRPRVSVLDTMYDWKAYYRPSLRLDGLSGFTKTKNDEITVRGFKIYRNQDGVPEVRWKRDPAIESAWRGADGGAGTGFNVIKHFPTGQPARVPPNPEPTAAPYLRVLASAAWRKTLESESKLECYQWIQDAARTGIIPVHEFLEDVKPAHEWGRLCKIGAVEGKRGSVRVITDLWTGATKEDMWRLPLGSDGEHVVAKSTTYHSSNDAAFTASAPLPLVRPRNVSSSQCLINNHPNNIHLPRASPRAPAAGRGGRGRGGARGGRGRGGARGGRGRGGARGGRGRGGARGRGGGRAVPQARQSTDEESEDDGDESDHSYGLSDVARDVEMSDGLVEQVGARRSSRAAPPVAYNNMEQDADEAEAEAEAEEEAEAEDAAEGQAEAEAEAEASEAVQDAAREPAPEAEGQAEAEVDVEAEAAVQEAEAARGSEPEPEEGEEPEPEPEPEAVATETTTAKACRYDVHVVFGTNESEVAELWYCIQHKGSGGRYLATCQYLEFFGDYYRVLGGDEKLDVPIRYTFKQVEFVEKTTRVMKNKKKNKKGKATVETTTRKALHDDEEVIKLFGEFKSGNQSH
jgi:hypothetical protein